MGGSTIVLDRALAAIEELDEAARKARDEATALRRHLAALQHGASPQVSYTVPDAARLMGIGERTLWRKIKTGEIDVIRIGRSTLVHHDAIEAFLAAKVGAPAGHPPAGPSTPPPPAPPRSHTDAAVTPRAAAAALPVRPFTGSAAPHET